MKSKDNFKTLHKTVNLCTQSGTPLYLVNIAVIVSIAQFLAVKYTSDDYGILRLVLIYTHYAPSIYCTFFVVLSQLFCHFIKSHFALT